ncbi:hypothetical protein O9G_002280 [Rozella allomycis CSF55]|uniref:NAD(P)-binding domain-containing protein n=1 Tax=Rozella allomycis (strain CSF55) TaxID=988480 RepID=A0A075AVC6_ROZAC|nr:hypothetical protein O9G_002280 [Rozella allomycis CSF55]|eukprot:EPZ32504.1 hypothetical protein O9G_002280 [Rozella allomycis CSF55]
MCEKLSLKIYKNSISDDKENYFSDWGSWIYVNYRPTDLCSGFHLTRHLANTYSDHSVVALDKVSKVSSNEAIKALKMIKNVSFIKIDLCQSERVSDIFSSHNINIIFHVAAYTNVDILFVKCAN